MELIAIQMPSVPLMVESVLYGSLKLGRTPGGGCKAGVVLGSIVDMMSLQ